MALSNNIKIIPGFTEAFIKDFTPNQTWVISLTEIEGFDETFIEYTTWDEEKDGPIPGIKLFKHHSLNENIANTNLIILITMETNFEYPQGSISRHLDSRGTTKINDLDYPRAYIISYMMPILV